MSMNWKDIEQELAARPAAAARDRDAFWREFRERAAGGERREKAPEPLGFGRWLALAAAAAAAVFAVVFLRPAPPPPLRVASNTLVKSVDVIASHGGVIIMSGEGEASGTVLWIADLNLDARKEK